MCSIFLRIIVEFVCVKQYIFNDSTVHAAPNIFLPCGREIHRCPTFFSTNLVDSRTNPRSVMYKYVRLGRFTTCGVETRRAALDRITKPSYVALTLNLFSVRLSRGRCSHPFEVHHWLSMYSWRAACPTPGYGCPGRQVLERATGEGGASATSEEPASQLEVRRMTPSRTTSLERLHNSNLSAPADRRHPSSLFRKHWQSLK